MAYTYQNINGIELHPQHFKYSFNYAKGEPVAIQMRKNKKAMIYMNNDPHIGRGQTCIEDPHSSFFQIPNSDKPREILYISGASGSGKTTYVKNFVKFWQLLYPKKKVYLFSKLQDDPSMKGLKNVQHVMMDDSYLDDPLEPSDLNNSFVIFEDIYALNNNELKKMIFDLIDDICCIGRHFDVSVAVTSHLLTNYRETRNILNEANFITFFPQSGSFHSIRYCLDKYFGIERSKINRLYDLDSRWVTISKNYPQYVIWQNGICLLRDI